MVAVAMLLSLISRCHVQLDASSGLLMSGCSLLAIFLFMTVFMFMNDAMLFQETWLTTFSGTWASIRLRRCCFDYLNYINYFSPMQKACLYFLTIIKLVCL
jgi:hypothetical protein